MASTVNPYEPQSAPVGRRYSVFAAPVLALFLREFYRDVGQHWRGSAFGYLFLLLIVCWIPITLQMSAGLNAFVAHDAAALTQQIPQISIKKGHVTVQAPQPVEIHTNNPQEVVAILDTTGKVTSLDGTKAVLLLTDKSLIMKKNETETQSYDLSKIDNFEFDGAIAQHWIELAAKWGPWIIYGIVVISEYIYRILLGIFYSLIGLAIASSVRCRLPFGGVLSVSIVALTAPILLGTLISLTKIQVPFLGFICLGIAIAYITFALRAIAEEPAPPIDESPAGGFNAG